MNSTLSFELWREVLHQDCVAEGKEAAFNAAGENVLMWLWKIGLAPTVEGISIRHKPDKST